LILVLSAFFVWSAKPGLFATVGPVLVVVTVALGSEAAAGGDEGALGPMGRDVPSLLLAVVAGPRVVFGTVATEGSVESAVVVLSPGAEEVLVVEADGACGGGVSAPPQAPAVSAQVNATILVFMSSPEFW
jgi:hypothetical protein